ncbi:benzoate 4-monooxygenase cytochrome P450 [Colletotrichum phormii]|uniref:Benzoate 4-monooxygenase cytochrome P450 n=1 Tax=Colletotrichum phormii TaxID=359342 RepID=A0AAI9ZWS6_9PEZI|nr:benzoate 4-monooxygenase cytochrome P450 [Colletotrichum phormii]KAK1638012.1 benzoate 4-monooxygenase cytochrome P450 [Colletotrichum phormii]
MTVSVHLPAFWPSFGWVETLTSLSLGCAFLGALVIWRRLCLDPLAHFPGPLSARFSNFNYSKSYLGGRQPYDVLKLHEKYGPVVRVAPNELSFDTSQSWKDIYAQRKGHGTFIKSAFYDGGNFADQAHSIVSERNPEKHGEMRKFISNAFSDRSLREQEGLVTGVVDQFIDQIGRLGVVPHSVDMSLWTHLLTFDIIGELAFGQTFGGVESGEQHAWVVAVVESMAQASLSDTLQRFPILGRVYLAMYPNWLKKLLVGAEKHQEFVISLVKKRMAAVTDRKDFMSHLLGQREAAGISDIQLSAHASDFVIAGSETTATTLATAIYYLCRHPEILQRLQLEIRGAFNDYSKIDGRSTSGLKYLTAVCLEALRILPPLSLALPRVVPPGGDLVDGHFIPASTIVATAPLAASMNPKSFNDPWKFDPERWLAMSPADQLEATQPFSLGTRSCLGKGLAWLEMRLTLSKMLFKYDLRLVNNDVDWHRDMQMQLLWNKPRLMVQFAAV